MYNERVIGKPATYGTAPQPGKFAAKNARTKFQNEQIEERKERIRQAIQTKKSQRRKFHVPQTKK